MSRRLVLLVSLMLLGLSGCVTMTDGYYREGYYSDGGYYYPAEDGYGDYYQGPEDVDYYYYDSYSYTPFWSLDRYACGAYYSCSPYWNSYYRRPYSGWSLGFGSHWNYGSWGWYGRGWSPWYDSHDYWRHSRRPGRPGHDQGRPPRDPDYQRPPRQDYTGQPRPGLREPGVIDDNGGAVRPPRTPRPRPDLQDSTDRGRWTQDAGYVRPLPSGERRDEKTVRPSDPRIAPGAGDAAPPEARTPRPDYRDFRATPRPQPQPREMPRFERREPREAPRFERPEPRETPRYERPEPRETPRYERPEPRYERPEPRQAPPPERAEPPEVRSTSQNESSEREE